jgi:hypothetical protein
MWNQINSVFNETYTIVWNGAVWVAGGQGLYTIANSPDGIHWNGSQSANTVFNRLNVQGDIPEFNNSALFGDNGATSQLGICNSVAWNGTMWIAGGEGINTLAYSSDGINWNGLGNPVFNDACFAVACNTLIWIAGGGYNNETMAYSLDGINWNENTFSIFTTACYIIVWNGSIWVAGGEGTNSIA